MEFEKISVPEVKKEKETKIKQGIMAYLPSVILTLLLIAMSSLGALIQFEFSIKSIVWTSFILTLFLRLVTTFMAKYVGSSIYYNKNLNSDAVKNAKKDFEEESKSLDKNSMDEYCKLVNFENKKIAYKKKKYSKIIRLKNRLDRLTHKNELDSCRIIERKIKRLNKRYERLTALVDEEYINKNIRYLKVKYPKVKSSYFLSSNEESVEKNVRYNFQFSKENTKSIAKSLPITIMLVLFGSLMGVNSYFGSVNVISILYDTAIIIFNFICGAYIVGRETISKTITAYVNRLTFISKYKAYSLKEKVQEVDEVKENQKNSD